MTVQPEQRSPIDLRARRLRRAADPHKIPIDSNGNLTAKTEGTDNWGYEWNAENQLTRVTKNSVEQARFSYDPVGRRVEKVAGGVTTSYAYDAEDILRELRGASTLKYVHGPGIDEPLARDDGAGALTYYHVDGLGSMAKWTSQAGTVVHEYRYDAWGGIEVGATEPGYAFTGREWDPETGLQYYRARYYDSHIGRFISEDPIEFEGGMNFYAYVGNKPADALDPYGLCALTPCQQKCLERLFDEDITKVKAEYKPNPKSAFAATTRKNKIIVYDCGEFLKPPILVEEYFHVLRQWNRKRLFGARYLADSAYRWAMPRQDRYWDNKYEKEAQRYAREHTTEFEECLKNCCPQ